MSNEPHPAESSGGLTKADLLQLDINESPARKGPWGHTSYSELSLTVSRKTQLCANLKWMSGFHSAKECYWAEHELGTHSSLAPTQSPNSDESLSELIHLLQQRLG